MKKIICFSLVILVLLTGCEVKNKQKGSDSMEIDFQKGIYYDKNWEETIGTYEYDVVPSKEVALNIATQVFEGMQKSADAQNYIPYSIFFDEQDEIWIVSFGKCSDEIIVGGDCSIAIQKKDGKVLRIWYGE